MVTDDRGRYLIPELPQANYSVWVRGYGLVDSEKVKSAAGKTLNLKAVAAPSAKAAAEYYPGMYWYSLLKIPDKSNFPGTGDKGNRISENIKTQEQWVDTVKNACQSCHALGSQGMRTVPKVFQESGNSFQAWARRTQAGQAMTNMATGLGYMGAEGALKHFADWTDRIAGGELPFAQPERPKGVERNVVITMWDWATNKAYLHDSIATDKDNPTVNANGKIYGAPEESTDMVPVLESGEAHRNADPASVARSGDAILDFAAERTVGVLGQRAGVGWPHEHPQSDDGSRGSRVVHVAHPAGGGAAGVLQRRLASVIEGRAAEGVAAPSVHVRPEDQQVDAHQHLLRDASPVFRFEGSELHALDERRRAG